MTNRQTRFHDLTREAHGCKLPDIATLFLEDLGGDLRYQVTLWDFNIAWEVFLPAKTVVTHLVVMDESLEHADAEERALKERTYKIRSLDAIAYALVTFQSQPKPVQTFLKGRYGPFLTEAKELAHERWKETVLE